MSEQPIVIVKMHAFIKSVIPAIEHFPRHQKHVLGKRLEEKALDLLDLFLEAYYGPKQSKKAKLYAANLSIEKLRHLIRLSFELKYINAKKLDHLMNQLLEIGKMTGGWLKSLK